MPTVRTLVPREIDVRNRDVRDRWLRRVRQRVDGPVGRRGGGPVAAHPESLGRDRGDRPVPGPVGGGVFERVLADDARLGELHDAVDAVPFRTIYTVVLNYDFELEYPWYALLDTDREHEVGWLAREELKPGHVPAGQTLLVAQMSPAWSSERYDDPSEEVKADAARLVADLLGDDRLADPEWTDRQGWRYALPDDGGDAEVLRVAEGAGLYVAGDWTVGEGRVHRAVETGLDVAERIANVE